MTSKYIPKVLSEKSISEVREYMYPGKRYQFSDFPTRFSTHTVLKKLISQGEVYKKEVEDRVGELTFWYVRK